MTATEFNHGLHGLHGFDGWGSQQPNMIATNMGLIGGHEKGVAARRGNKRGRARAYALFIDGEWVSCAELHAQVHRGWLRFWALRQEAPPSQLDWWKVGIEERRARERVASEREQGTGDGGQETLNPRVSA